MTASFLKTQLFRLMLITAAAIPASALAQSNDDHHNIYIDDATDDISFARVKGGEGLVEVHETSSTVYACRDYRASLPVIEFYNDQTQLDDVKVFTDGNRNRSIQPKNEYYSQDGIFFSDARVCYLELPFAKKGSTAEVVFEKTILNPRYFTSVYLTEGEETKQKTVTITVPEWMMIDIKEMNFEGWDISRSKAKKDDNTVYTYIIRNAKPLKKEEHAPGPTYYVPHLLVMTKESQADGITRTYFKTLGDQYKWYHSLVNKIGNDTTSIRQKALEITAGKSSDLEKVKAIYYWVQHNIRYIAYEDGIAGYQPQKAQEVLRKKYGDCKGMANLTATMVRAAGLDARLCWLGTNHMVYDYSTPSLSVDNHMIAAWMHNGKPVFLDGTEKFLGFGETAERIQGRQVLIEDGDKYLLETIPVATHAQNASTEKRVMSISGQDLKGKVTHVYKGENKEAILQLMDGVKSDRRDVILHKLLSGGDPNYEISNLTTTDLSDYSGDLVIEYELLQKGVLTKFGAEQYLDVDNRRQFADYSVDTAAHHLPYLFPFKDHQILDVTIVLPTGAKINSLPKEVDLNKAAYGYNGKWQQKGTELKYHAESWMDKTYYPVNQFATLNTDLNLLKTFYNAQPELSL